MEAFESPEVRSRGQQLCRVTCTLIPANANIRYHMSNVNESAMF